MQIREDYLKDLEKMCQICKKEVASFICPDCKRSIGKGCFNNRTGLCLICDNKRISYA